MMKPGLGLNSENEKDLKGFRCLHIPITQGTLNIQRERKISKENPGHS